MGSRNNYRVVHNLTTDTTAAESMYYGLNTAAKSEPGIALLTPIVPKWSILLLFSIPAHLNTQQSVS